ncbi:ornithine cyclodeaminase family protein [Alteribacillus iranensis]|uniref:Ornithine cyclodeaminase n=1 Tax=Alteribacillus iranensis TaxID=930128 RepID=A0A1I2E930_9BACI|nr:ornithine cyclodeaminase family protein [Alteribacillus iranensis]SFE89462.1 ornithine cyclodeaminase [Alteribacillus iranensis]
MKNVALRYLSRDDIKQLNVSMQDTINIVEQTYIAHASDKVHLPSKIGIHPNNSGFFHTMPAMVMDPDSVGMKWVSYFPGNHSRNNLPDSSCIMILNDINTGLPICIMEALHFTYMRTAASGAVAVKRLSVPDSRVLGIVGAGTIARWSVHAILSVKPEINEIRVISRTEESRNNFCEELEEQYKNVNFIPCSDTKSVMEESDIVLSITSNSADPFLNFEHLRKGGLALSLDGIKSWDLSFMDADYIVTDDRNFLKGEIERKYRNTKVEREIYEISEVMESSDLQWSEDKKGIAFMNGIGSTDVTLGKYIYDQAVKENVGIILPFS